MINPDAINTVLQHLLPAIRLHRSKASEPFILGLSGLQGSGKSTWAEALTVALNETPDISAKTLSLDDFYHDHPQLVSLREADAENALLRTRGQPGTHDEVLAQQFFESLAKRQGSEIDLTGAGGRGDTRWPAFDKSLHNGEGGRVPESQWDTTSYDEPLDVVIFEGWCLGFQSLSPDILEKKWKAAQLYKADTSSDQPQTSLSTQTLADHQLRHLLLINENLERYCQSFMGPDMFDAFVHLDTEQLRNVYAWRLNQEAALWKSKGSGMTDEQVIAFVKGYMPAYELYLERLSAGDFFPRAKDGGLDKIHLRIMLDEQRRICALQKVP